MKTTRPALVVGLIVILVAACSSAGQQNSPSPGAASTAPSTAATGSATFKIAGLAGLTGRFANYGQDFQRGALLAADQLNAAGGVLGAKVDVSFQDTANDPVATVRLARQAASDPSIAAIVGPNDSASGLALAPVLPDLKIVGMLGGQAPWNGSFNQWTFRTQLPINQAAAPLASALADQLHVKTLAITYASDNDFSKRESQSLQDAVKKANISVVDVEAYKTGDTDFSTQITNIMSHNPDAWYLSGTVKESGNIILQARNAGYKGLFVGGYSILQDPSIMKLTNNDAAGSITWGQTQYTSSRPQMQKFYQSFKAKYGVDPGDSACGAYTAVLLLANAAKTAGTTTNRQAIRDALGKTTGFAGPWTDYTYKGSGDNTTPTVILFKVNSQGQAVPMQ